MKKSIHLICNAHLDPVWLWQREEGIAEALSTFRIAAGFCEEYDNFIFCHNEVILYEWVEQYEPVLFKRIQKLVKTGRWHIMGGWYLQPDCNMISGESLIRQITLGKEYFQKKFGVYPETAVNFDPFGHSRGLVQILSKAGFQSYLFMRPIAERCKLPDDIFRWQGYNGSEITGHRLFGAYLTLRGEACAKLRKFVSVNHKHKVGAVTWGIGNHGGGPSRVDLEDLNKYIEDHPEFNIRHSTPDNFFAELKKTGTILPVHAEEMNFFATGCYTSQVRIKQEHRKLESEFTLTEKMASSACLTADYEYPAEKLREAAFDLAFCEFHDILPGSGIKAVEDDSLRQIAHGREILSRLRTDALFSMLKGQGAAKDGDMPLFVWNPHPYPVNTLIECEMQMADQNHKDTFFDIEIFKNGKKLTSQIEHESSNLNLDWRKKFVFEADLAPGSITRYECRPKEMPQKPENNIESFTFDNGQMSLKINRRSGLIDSFKIAGKELFRPGAGRVMVMRDNADSWGSDTKSYRKRIGSFSLMNRAEASEFAGFNLSPVRIIENGNVRIVVEALFKYKHSNLRMRYYIPKRGAEFELRMQMNNQQPNCMYKMSFPFVDKESACAAQDIFGRKDIPGTGDEKVFSQWFAAYSKIDNTALAVICDSGHGLDFFKGEMRYSLLRSPCYSALPIGTRPLISEDRAHDHIDIGQRNFRFKICGGSADKLLLKIEKETMLFAETPPSILFYPAGNGNKIMPKTLVKLSDGPVVMTSCRCVAGNNLIVRIFNPAAEAVKTELSVLDKSKIKIELSSFEVKNLKFNGKTNVITEVNGIE